MDNIRENKLRKIWIDCGSHMGMMTWRFVASDDYNESFELYAFDVVNRMKSFVTSALDIKFINKAVWIEDGEITIHLSPNMRGTATGIYPNKKLRRGQSLTESKIESVDFSHWIMNNFDPSDYLVVKLDIEGAEFKVLEKMIQDGSINYINKLYVEFHSSFYKHGFDFNTDQAQKDLTERLSNIESLELIIGEIPFPDKLKESV